jgi:hypothetical protein
LPALSAALSYSRFVAGDTDIEILTRFSLSEMVGRPGPGRAPGFLAKGFYLIAKLPQRSIENKGSPLGVVP